MRNPSWRVIVQYPCSYPLPVVFSTHRQARAFARSQRRMGWTTLIRPVT